jgi:integrase
MLNYAVDAGLLGVSPAARLRLPHISLVDRPVLGADDLERLAEALGDGATMMWLGVVGGLRWGECAGLTAGAIDTLAGTVTVSQQLDEGKLSPPKSEAGRRKLAILAWLVEDLVEHLSRRGLTAGRSDALVFVSARGVPLRYPNWHQRVWRPACREAGLPELRFHDLRSMSATALVAVGADVRTAQTRLGHSSPVITLGIYARATAEADRRAADAVGASLRPSVARRMHAGDS